MKVSYSKLLKKLIDMRMTKKDLVKFAGITTNACVSIQREEPIAMNAAIKLCRAFDCTIGDIMEFSFEDEKGSYKEDTLPGSAADYIYDIDPITGLARIYKQISNPDNPNGRPLLALVKMIDSDKITEALFPEDKDTDYEKYKLENTIRRRTWSVRTGSGDSDVLQ